jgi:hypothetical protein
MQKITAEICPMYAVKPEDAALFSGWASLQRSNIDLDKSVLSYPRSCMTRALIGSETIAMIPLQPVFMFESLVHKPELTAKQTAMALWRIGETTEQVAALTGHREAYFITNDEAEARSCEKHGWEICLHDQVKQQWLMKRKFEGRKCE